MGSGWHDIPGMHVRDVERIRLFELLGLLPEFLLPLAPLLLFLLLLGPPPRFSEVVTGAIARVDVRVGVRRARGRIIIKI